MGIKLPKSANLDSNFSELFTYLYNFYNKEIKSIKKVDKFMFKILKEADNAVNRHVPDDSIAEIQIFLHCFLDDTVIKYKKRISELELENKRLKISSGLFD